MWPSSRYEFTAGTRVSLSPLATRVRWVIPASRALAHTGDAPVSDRFRLRVTDGQRRGLVATLTGQAAWGYRLATPADSPARTRLLVSSAMISASPAAMPSMASWATALRRQLQAQRVGQRPLRRLGGAVGAG